MEAWTPPFGEAQTDFLEKQRARQKKIRASVSLFGLKLYAKMCFELEGLLGAALRGGWEGGGRGGEPD